MKQKLFCIYHHVDFDGICSAKIVEEAHLDYEFIPIPWNYGEPSPLPSLLDSIKKESQTPLIVIVDVCLPIEEVEILLSYVGKSNFIWIDHHKTSIEKMQDAGLGQVLGARILEEAACVIAYKYFNSSKGEDGNLIFPLIPMGVQLIGCMDIWDQSGKHYDWESQILLFYSGLEGTCNNIKNFPSIVELNNKDFIEETIGKGNIITKYLNSKRKNFSDKSFVVTIDGMRLLALNTAQRGSSILYPLFNPEIHDGVMMFSYDGQNGIWTYSLYTIKEGIDLSSIAKQRSEGGHPQACGFETENLIEELKELII